MSSLNYTAAEVRNLAETKEPAGYIFPTADICIFLVVLTMRTRSEYLPNSINLVVLVISALCAFCKVKERFLAPLRRVLCSEL
jgi:hypothetical protein